MRLLLKSKIEDLVLSSTQQLIKEKTVNKSDYDYVYDYDYKYYNSNTYHNTLNNATIICAVPSVSSKQKSDQYKHNYYSNNNNTNTYDSSFFSCFFPLTSLVRSSIVYIFSLFQFTYDSIRYFFLFCFYPFQLLIDYIKRQLYFIYIVIPMTIWSFVWGQILHGLCHFCRRYELARKCLIHISEILKLGELIWRKAKSTTLLDLIGFILQTAVEILTAWLWPSAFPSRNQPRTRSLTELSELLAYEECQLQQQQFNNNGNGNNYGDFNNNNINSSSYTGTTGIAGGIADDSTTTQQQQQQQQIQQQQKLRLAQLQNRKAYMHHDIPFNPFKATIKVRKLVPLSTGGALAVTHPHSHSSPSLPTATATAVSCNNTSVTTTTGMSGVSVSATGGSGVGNSVHSRTDDTDSLLNFETEMLSDAFLEQYSILNEAGTPASFPPTPFSRAHVMNRSAERVNSVMFAARDKLRQAVQSLSADAQSRQYAQENRSYGYLAIFDAKKSSENIALSCGNHCIMKIGNSSFCSSSQSMVPLITGNYVYFEFSMTVSNNQIPSLAIGLSPPDAPLNVTVGTWPQSIAINTEGQLLIQGNHWSPTVGTISTGTAVSSSQSHSQLSKSQQSSQSHSKSASLNQSQSGKRLLQPGATIGFLVYLPPSDNENNYENTNDGNRNNAMVPSAQSLQAQLQKVIDGSSSNSNKNGANAVKSTASKSDSAINATSQTSATSEIPLPSSSSSSAAAESSATTPSLVFKVHIDGEAIHYPTESLNFLNVAATEIQQYQTPLYPTVSLLSNNTRIWCRFCEADIVYRNNRKLIGAPVGTRVYCIDGSILIHEDD